jgi:hypothetical protein
MSSEKIKQVLHDYLELKQTRMELQVIQGTMGIFLWGFMCGVIFSYTSLLSLMVGTCLGYAIAVKNVPWMMQNIPWIQKSLEYGKKYIL